MALYMDILRAGRPYRSVETAPVPSVRGGASLATLSIANAGMIRRDASAWRAGAAALAAMPAAERVARTVAAADLFARADLPVGDAVVGPDEHLALVAASTGLPHALVRAGLAKVEASMRAAGEVVHGLSRGIPLAALDVGEAVVDGVRVGLVQTVHTLGAVLPSNAPGVHTLWTAAPAMGVALALKPGRGDVWTPRRVLEAMRAAGLPEEALSYYPAEHDGGGALVERADRVMVFGGEAAMRAWPGATNLELHGPGYSKVLLGEGAVLDEALLDELVLSVSNNGGRSCINASTIVVASGADALAEALAARLAQIAPRGLADPAATLAAFGDPRVAAAIDASIDGALDGATEVSAALRGGPRRVQHDDMCFLLPTVVRCPPEHALAQTELPFPFVSVVELPSAAVASWIGPTLVASVYGDDAALWDAVRRSTRVDRLHRGRPTPHIRWDQPHEGNLFDACWRRRGVA